MTPYLAFWLGALAGGLFMTVTVLFWVAIIEKMTSRKLLKTAEQGHSVDVILPTGKRHQLLLAPEAAR